MNWLGTTDAEGRLPYSLMIKSLMWGNSAMLQLRPLLNRRENKLLDRKDRSPDLAEFVIQGITKDGTAFRPSNWGERLGDMLSTTGHDGRIVYSSCLRPVVIQGVPSVAVRFSLETADPNAFGLARQFVVANHLTVRAGRNRTGAGATGLFPAINMERRSPQNNGWQRPSCRVS
jgi:Protein of unknown function (DUF3579)